FERLTNRGQRNSRALRHFDNRDTTEHLAGIPSLVSAVPPAPDKPLRFIEMKRGDGHATACRDFAHSQFAMEAEPVSFRFHFPLDLKLTRGCTVIPKDLQ